ncbi:hypothetical protein AMJ85_02435 [candidate division BRC1 bacterium SM23_51]|nr:MAG: hypothetical protein AMJ85_02435 [candidate division BRC1 bacterium SM23_51]
MAKIRAVSEVEPRAMEGEAVGVSMRVLIAPDDGAPNFVMRLFVIESGGRTPFHAHPWEHEVFVLEGKGVVVTEVGETPVGPEQAVFVAPGEKHCFRNTGEGDLCFLCLVPTEKNYASDT